MTLSRKRFAWFDNTNQPVGKYLLREQRGDALENGSDSDAVVGHVTYAEYQARDRVLIGTGATQTSTGAPIAVHSISAAAQFLFRPADPNDEQFGSSGGTSRLDFYPPHIAVKQLNVQGDIGRGFIYTEINDSNQTWAGNIYTLDEDAEVYNQVIVFNGTIPGRTIRLRDIRNQTPNGDNRMVRIINDGTVSVSLTGFDEGASVIQQIGPSPSVSIGAGSSFHILAMRAVADGGRYSDAKSKWVIMASH